MGEKDKSAEECARLCSCKPEEKNCDYNPNSQCIEHKWDESSQLCKLFRGGRKVTRLPCPYILHMPVCVYSCGTGMWTGS